MKINLKLDFFQFKKDDSNCKKFQQSINQQIEIISLIKCLSIFNLNCNGNLKFLQYRTEGEFISFTFQYSNCGEQFSTSNSESKRILGKKNSKSGFRQLM